MQELNALGNGMQELSAAEVDEVSGGFFFVLLAFDIAILAYDAYGYSR